MGDIIEIVEGAIKAGIEASLFNGDYEKVVKKLRDLGVVLTN